MWAFGTVVTSASTVYKYISQHFNHQPLLKVIKDDLENLSYTVSSISYVLIIFEMMILYYVLQHECTVLVITENYRKVCN